MNAVTVLEHRDFYMTANLSQQEIREKIAAIEEELRKLPQVELPLRHFFSNGVYARELSIPKGAMLTGRIHRFENMSIITRGEVTVLSIDGLVHLKAGDIMVARAGVKRLIYAHEDTLWTTVHATQERNVEKLWDELTADSYEEMGLLDHNVIEMLEEKL